MIAKDIQALLSEKIQLEKESQSTDYNMSVKKTEQHSLQSEYDTLASTLKQLTNQKDVAQKRLDDLDTQVCWYTPIILVGNLRSVIWPFHTEVVIVGA